MKYTDVMKPEDISIGHCWNTFAGLVLSGVSDIQRSEMRKAFYAGFSEGFKIMVDVSSELTEEQAVQVLDRLNAESNEFVMKMVADLQHGS
jgi:hypothetical protein